MSQFLIYVALVCYLLTSNIHDYSINPLVSQVRQLGVTMNLLDIQTIIWLFPIIFMIHDFEEIIFINQWKKNSYYEALKIKPFNDFLSTASFSIAVAQEFIIFSIVSIFSVISNNYFLWFGLFSAIFIHFLLHIIISLKISKYHPGLFTSIVFTPLSLYLLYLAKVAIGFNLFSVVTSSLVGIILLFLNLKLLHKLMPIFDKSVKLI